MPARSPAEGTFELGLVMAGAVSAGAYTAGVLDFLFEALDAWEVHKRAGDANVPDHKVQIRAVSGASAGGIVSALSAMLPFTRHHPVNDLSRVVYANSPANGLKNLLYRSWVADIDFEQMLGTKDLSGSSKVVRSLLNSDVIDKVAGAAVAEVRDAIKAERMPGAPSVTRPGYLANPLQLFLSLANLRGVPYLITMQTEGGGVRGHRMKAHMDYAHFAVFGTNNGPHESLPGGATPVNWDKGGTVKDGWDELIGASMSTSAFPVGLRSRPYKNDISVYQFKLWSRSFGDAPNTRAPTIAPDLNPNEARPYEFWTCDGGLLNNEPLEYARVALSGAPDERNPRDAKVADRAILLIDPFPDDNGQRAPENRDLGDVVSLIFSLIPSLISQARFKPQELALALDESVYSRFLVAPVREGRKEKESDLASSGLSGFAGFLHESFRRHDFQLGRANCQKFLRDHLAVHVDNPIVAGWVSRLRTNGQLTRFHTRTRDVALGTDKVDTNFVQLIPLMESVSQRVMPLPWPKIPDGATQFVERLTPQLKARLEAVVERVVPSLMKLMSADKGIFAGLVGWLAEKKLRSKLLEIATEKIADDLKARGLG
ncbi:MAG: patatin-like phospholipase family protein [Alphaproteobacteria bacterium]|nr:patatin-like phospholipase family protein [Alphaproteobacteria bacterium]